MAVKRTTWAVRMGAALALASFLLANGLSASGLHSAIQAEAQPPAPGPHAHAAAEGAHSAVDAQGGEPHDHASDDCLCLGTCASATPRAAPAADEAIAPPGGVEHDGIPRPVTAGLLGPLKAYLFPLPNAPPLPA